MPLLGMSLATQCPLLRQHDQLSMSAVLHSGTVSMKVFVVAELGHQL